MQQLIEDWDNYNGRIRLKFGPLLRKWQTKMFQGPQHRSLMHSFTQILSILHTLSLACSLILTPLHAELNLTKHCSYSALSVCSRDFFVCFGNVWWSPSPLCMRVQVCKSVMTCNNDDSIPCHFGVQTFLVNLIVAVRIWVPPTTYIVLTEWENICRSPHF